MFDTISSCMQRHKMLKLREIWDIRMLQSKGLQESSVTNDTHENYEKGFRRFEKICKKGVDIVMFKTYNALTAQHSTAQHSTAQHSTGKLCQLKIKYDNTSTF